MFQCPQCPDKMFQLERNLKIHHYSRHKVHHEVLKCDEYGKKVDNKFKLSDHKKHHRKEFCELCKIYFSKNNFKRHQLEKHSNIVT